MTIDLTLENFCVWQQRQDFEIQCDFEKQAFILQNQNLALTVSCVLQCVAACCSVLQCAAVLQRAAVLQCAAVCCCDCIFLPYQCDAVCWKYVGVCYSVLECITVCWSVLKCV